MALCGSIPTYVFTFTLILFSSMLPMHLSWRGLSSSNSPTPKSSNSNSVQLKTNRYSFEIAINALYFSTHIISLRKQFMCPETKVKVL